MKNILVIILCWSTLSLSAQGVYDQLLALNQQWAHHPHVGLQNEPTRAWSETDLIRFHLLQVVHQLRTDTGNWTVDQRKRRNVLLDTLENYAWRGKFPNNDHHPENRQPYFVGSNGNACAVGHLMLASARHREVSQIVQANNYAYVSEIDPITYTAWMKESGFRPEELAWIQPTYNFDPYQHPVNPQCGKSDQSGSGHMHYDGEEQGTMRTGPWYEGECKDGVLHGKWRQWHSLHRTKEDKIWIEGEFKEGLKTGIWKRYQINGKLTDQVAFKEGKRHGLMQRFDFQGKENYHLEFVNGEPHGFGYLKHDSVLLQEVYYDHGKPVGHWKMRDYNSFLWLEIKFDDNGVTLYRVINTSGDLFTIERKGGRYFAKLNQVEDKGWQGEVVMDSLATVPMVRNIYEFDDGIWSFQQWGFKGFFKRHGEWINVNQADKIQKRYYQRDTLLASVEIDSLNGTRNEKWTEWFPKVQSTHPQYFCLTSTPRGMRMKTVATYKNHKRDGYLYTYYLKGHIRVYEHIREGKLFGWRIGKIEGQEYPSVFCETIMGEPNKFKIYEYGSRDSMTYTMEKNEAEMKNTHQMFIKQVGYDPSAYQYKNLIKRYPVSGL